VRKIVLTGAIVIGSPLSVSWSTMDKNFTLSQDKAAAAIGKPLSAGSVAGVQPTRASRKSQHRQI